MSTLNRKLVNIEANVELGTETGHEIPDANFALHFECRFLVSLQRIGHGGLSDRTEEQFGGRLRLCCVIPLARGLGAGSLIMKHELDRLLNRRVFYGVGQ